MLATFDEFKTEWLSKRVADPLLGKIEPPLPPEQWYQCVSLIKQYLRECCGISAGFWGDAINYWTNTNPALLVKFNRLETPSVVKADIVVLYGVHTGHGYSPGHIVLATGAANTTQFEAMEQDGATGIGDGLNGNAIRLRWLDKSRIAGVLRLKPVVIKQTFKPTTERVVKVEITKPAAYVLPFKPITAPSGRDLFIIKDLPGYYTAGLAATRKNANSTVYRGNYHVYREYNGMINVTLIPGHPGYWINPGDNIVGNIPHKPKLDPAVQAKADAMAVHTEPQPITDIRDGSLQDSGNTTTLERQILHTTTLRDKVVIGYNKLASLLK